MNRAADLPLEDEGERAAALDTSRSFIVQAPAGSGKTELLIRRYLTLLAEVDEPEEILAITFTRAATAEMRERVLGALDRAKRWESGGEVENDALVSAARRALGNDQKRSWNLLEQTQRLNIQTIDSLCLQIVSRTPLLSKLGGAPRPTERAEAFYALAARRTLSRLGGSRDDLNGAVAALLRLRDAKVNDCEQLIAGMLERREQWGDLLVMNKQDAREELEAPLRRETSRVMEKTRLLLASDGETVRELFSLLGCLCGAAARADSQRYASLDGVTCLDHLTDDSHWSALCDFLLTGEGGWRKSPASAGFSPEHEDEKKRYKEMIARLRAIPGLLELLNDIGELPAASYSDEQWELLWQIVLILRYAVVELLLIFAEEGVVDFTEVGLAARRALREVGSAEGLSPEGLGWRHLLVDEFQDTSRGQYELLKLLTAEWKQGDGCSCFLVGDPMQSIYGFRQAEVELFESTRQRGLGDSFPLHPLTLRTNFRSHAGLVDELNPIFAKVFADAGNAGIRYPVRFAPSVASRPAPEGVESVSLKIGVTPSFIPDASRQEPQREAQATVQIIQSAMQASQGQPDFSIAVLVRAKNHLQLIAQALKEAGIRYRAVEIEALSDRQEILDLISLARCLLHPMDRIAWLSVLRAPWCGLRLDDLHMLGGQDSQVLLKRPVLELLRMRIPLLSDDGQKRASRAAAVLEVGLREMHRQPSFSLWLERVWDSLGGREYLDAAEAENARAFFRLLEEVHPDDAGFEEQLERLFAEPDPKTNDRSGLQLMTIHKAKGLSFDVVIVPGLQRQTSNDKQPLLNWFERTVLQGQEGMESQEILAAPIGRKGEKDRIYQWISRQRERRNREERKRLLYVGSTRARRQLYLLGSVTTKGPGDDGTISFGTGKSQTLLKTAWPAIEGRLRAELEQTVRQLAEAVPATGANAAPPSSNASSLLSLNGLRLRRLPVDWRREDGASPSMASPPTERKARAAEQGVHANRSAGSLRSRAVGIAVHALFEELANRSLPGAAAALSTPLEQWRPRAIALLRNAGLPRARANTEAATVLRLLQAAWEDDLGRWLISAQNSAEAESAWSLWKGDADTARTLSTLRADRMFRAGSEPCSPGATHLWIVDYKTAHADEGNADSFLTGERERHKEQLESYGRLMRKVHGEDLPLRLALYYPLFRKLIWWNPGESSTAIPD